MSSRVTFVLSAQRSRIKRIFRKWTSSCSQYRHKDSGKLYCSPSRASHRNTIRETLIKLRGSLVGENLPLLIFVNKGIETATQALTLEIIADTCGSDIARAATFISGPSFAAEIIRRQPTSVSVASLTESQAQKASQIFHQPWFRW
jgi:hypothetical protein